MNTKKPWQSSTMWGAAMLLLAWGLNAMGVDFTAGEQADLTSKGIAAIDNVMEIVGFGLVVIGRWKASKKLSILS